MSGSGGIRTHDQRVSYAALLCTLSYTPMVGLDGVEPPTSRGRTTTLPSALPLSYSPGVQTQKAHQAHSGQWAD